MVGKPRNFPCALVRIARTRCSAQRAARSDSDVDLIVTLSRPLGLEFFAVQEELSRRLALPVEMFTEQELARDIKAKALADAIDA